MRTHLIDQGVSSTQIEAQGRGESEPVAENSSPEGRANNRRVEIIVENAEQKTAASPVKPPTMAKP